MTIGTLKEYKTNLFQLGRQSSPVLFRCPSCKTSLISPKYESDLFRCPKCQIIFENAKNGKVLDDPGDAEEVPLYDV